jgi:hypothetical protein
MKKAEGVRERYLMIDDYILDIMNNFQNYYQSYFSHWSQDIIQKALRKKYFQVL